MGKGCWASPSCGQGLFLAPLLRSDHWWLRDHLWWPGFKQGSAGCKTSTLLPVKASVNFFFFQSVSPLTCWFYSYYFKVWLTITLPRITVKPIPSFNYFVLVLIAIPIDKPLQFHMDLQNLPRFLALFPSSTCPLSPGCCHVSFDSWKSLLFFFCFPRGLFYRIRVVLSLLLSLLHRPSF